MTPSRFDILTLLEAHPEGLRVCEIATSRGYSRQNAAEMLARCKKYNAARQHRFGPAKRNALWFLTPRGLRYLDYWRIDMGYSPDQGRRVVLNAVEVDPTLHHER